MLQVLTAQILAGERERAIQRELREQAVRKAAQAARRDAEAAAVNEREATERPCLDCPPQLAARPR